MVLVTSMKSAMPFLSGKISLEKYTHNLMGREKNFDARRKVPSSQRIIWESLSTPTINGDTSMSQNTSLQVIME